jgi:hypothetical protein
MLIVVLWGLMFGVASLTACWSILSRLLVSNSTSSCSLSFIDRFTLSCIIRLLVSQFVCELGKRGVGFLTITDVLIVAIIGEWSEIRS